MESATMISQFSIRLIKESDVDGVLAIYGPYVRDTIISFEYEVPTPEEYLHRIRTNTIGYPWLVCLHGRKMVGFAYGSSHRNRTAYRWSAESTVYIVPEFHRRGIARILYETLFAMLQAQGYFNVYAGVTLPNDKSVAFHKALGFEEVGIYKNTGYKFGKWHDTQWFQLHLAGHIIDPPVPETMKEMVSGDEFHRILADANDRLKGIDPEHK